MRSAAHRAACRAGKWWDPDEVILAQSLPHAATGKLLKTELRRLYAG